MAVQYNNKKKSNSDEETLRVAREDFKLAEEAWADIYQLADEDTSFVAGEQWDARVKREREHEFRPSLTVNRMPGNVRQITNDQRQNRPSLKVSPVDDLTDIDTAKIIQGVVKNIENRSRADSAYDTAFEGAVIGGIGFYRIFTDYVSHKTFDQEIRYGRIADFRTVYIDPFSKEPDGSDMNFGFIFSNVAKDAFKASYKESKLSQVNAWDSYREESQGWVTDNSCRVAEYYKKEFKNITLVQVKVQDSDEQGQVVESLKTIDRNELPDDFPDELITNQRAAQIHTITHYKINGLEILEKTIFPGQWIPIVPVYGNEIIVKGKRILEGVIRHAKDSQRMYNLMASTEAEVIALAPKAPFIVAEGQIPKEYEAQWLNANKKTQAFLTYKPISHNGQPLGAPQRNTYEAPVGAISSARMQSSEDIKATTGIYDASLGNRSNENSGIAIQRRNAQAQTSNFHLVDNLTRSIRHGGRIVVDLIPHIYDAARVERIIGEEGQEQIVKLNQMFQKNGEEKIYDTSVGQYDVNVEIGPSFATKRQEAAAAMIEFTRAMPQQAALISDLIAKNSDWPGATEIAERLKKGLPPGIAEETGDDKPKIPPETQAQLQQMNEMIEGLTEKLKEKTEAERTKIIELESKERIAFAQIEADLTKEKIKLTGLATLKTLEAEIQDASNRLELLRINEPFEQEQENQNYMEPGFNQAAASNEQMETQQPIGGQFTE